MATREKRSNRFIDRAELHRAVLWVREAGKRLLFDGVKADGVNAAVGAMLAEAMSAEIAMERMINK